MSKCSCLIHRRCMRHSLRQLRLQSPDIWVEQLSLLSHLRVSNWRYRPSICTVSWQNHMYHSWQCTQSAYWDICKLKDCCRWTNNERYWQLHSIDCSRNLPLYLHTLNSLWWFGWLLKDTVLSDPQWYSQLREWIQLYKLCIRSFCLHSKRKSCSFHRSGHSSCTLSQSLELKEWIQCHRCYKHMHLKQQRTWGNYKPVENW